MEQNKVPGRVSKFSASNSPQSSSEPENLALVNALRYAACNAQSHPDQSLQWVTPFSVAPLSVAETDARFNEAHPPGPRGVKRRGGGRPRKPDSELKRPRADPRSRPTRLRPNKTVDIHIPSDVWFHIFLFTDYKTVRSLRETCRNTYEATDSVIFWKEYIRRHAYPPDSHMSLPIPEPPSTLTFLQYADLLFGQGCMRCGAAKSKKIQWAFYRRWCKTCFSEMTYSDSEAKAITTKYGDLLGCIPTAIIDIWKNYHCVSHLTANKIPPNYRSMKKYIAVTKKDLTIIVNDCEAFLNTLPSELVEAEREEQLKTWRHDKTVENLTYLIRAKACEDFANLRDDWIMTININEGPDYRKERENFFASKAARLQPPVPSRVLQQIPGYQKSVAVKRPPTERSWREILRNIDQYREPAERAAIPSSYLHRLPGISALQRLQQRHNSSQESVATPLLEEFAIKVMKELENEEVAPDDFTYFTLQRIRERYYQLSESERPPSNEDDVVKPHEGSDRYVLTMQDALSVYSRHVEPYMKNWQLEGTIKRVPRFFCPACTRKDYRREWCFDRLFHHLVYSHGKRDLSSPWRSYAETEYAREFDGLFQDLFHWQALAWPHNLPILAAHHRPTGTWDPDDRHYEQAPLPEEASDASPFDGRSVRKCETKNSSVVAVAADAICEAARALADTKAIPQIKAMIAWRYATDNIEKIANEKLSSNHLDDLSTALIRHGEFAIFSKVGCKFCEMQCDPQTDRYMSVRSHLKYTEIKHSFDTIVRHWKLDHVGANRRFDVATEMLLFPSNLELAHELSEDTDEAILLREVFDYLFPFKVTSGAGTSSEAGESDPTAQSSSTTTLDQTALNLLAEQAIKIDPRLTVDEESDNGAYEGEKDTGDEGEEKEDGDAVDAV